MVSRNLTKGNYARKAILQAFPQASVHVLEADLASLQ